MAEVSPKYTLVQKTAIAWLAIIWLICIYFVHKENPISPQTIKSFIAMCGIYTVPAFLIFLSIHIQRLPETFSKGNVMGLLTLAVMSCFLMMVVTATNRNSAGWVFFFASIVFWGGAIISLVASSITSYSTRPVRKITQADESETK